MSPPATSAAVWPLHHSISTLRRSVCVYGCVGVWMCLWVSVWVCVCVCVIDSCSIYVSFNHLLYNKSLHHVFVCVFFY